MLFLQLLLGLMLGLSSTALQVNPPDEEDDDDDEEIPAELRTPAAQRILGRLLSKERKKERSKLEAAAAEKEAADKEAEKQRRLLEEGKYKEASEATEKELAEAKEKLKSAEERAAKYDEQLTKEFDEAVKVLPASIQELAPKAEVAPLEERLDWVRKMAKEIGKDKRQSGPPRDPKPGAPGDSEDIAAQAKGPLGTRTTRQQLDRGAWCARE